nr:hypothetical protein [Methylomarinum sp. Ch1-1]MDP4519382.1 hypothetical protein [Methylomarinum sp. Ch1-1]
MAHDKSPHQLVHQELALDSYLKTLLDEIPSDDAASALDNAEAQLEPARQQATEPLAPPPLEQAPKMPDIDVESSAIVNAPAVIKRQPLSLMPEWSRHEFQALFFKVDQLILAAPLTELLRTITITRQPTKIPGQPSWFIGLLDDQDKRVGVLDTGQLVYGKSRGAA